MSVPDDTRVTLRSWVPGYLCTRHTTARHVEGDVAASIERGAYRVDLRADGAENWITVHG